jgi:hypothetical protein
MYIIYSIYILCIFMYTYCIAMNMHYIYIHLSMKCMEMPSYVIGPSSSSSARDACHPVASLGRKLSNWRWYDRLWYCCLELMAILKGCVQWVAFVRGTQNEVSKAQIGSSSFQSCIIRIQGVGDWSSSMPFQRWKTNSMLSCMHEYSPLPPMVHPLNNQTSAYVWAFSASSWRLQAILCPAQVRLQFQSHLTWMRLEDTDHHGKQLLPRAEARGICIYGI